MSSHNFQEQLRRELQMMEKKIKIVSKPVYPKQWFPHGRTLFQSQTFLSSNGNHPNSHFAGCSCPTKFQCNFLVSVSLLSDSNQSRGSVAIAYGCNCIVVIVDPLTCQVIEWVFQPLTHAGCSNPGAPPSSCHLCKKTPAPQLRL